MYIDSGKGNEVDPGISSYMTVKRCKKVGLVREYSTNVKGKGNEVCLEFKTLRHDSFLEFETSVFYDHSLRFTRDDT